MAPSYESLRPFPHPSSITSPTLVLSVLLTSNFFAACGGFSQVFFSCGLKELIGARLLSGK